MSQANISLVLSGVGSYTGLEASRSVPSRSVPSAEQLVAELDAKTPQLDAEPVETHAGEQ